MNNTELKSCDDAFKEKNDFENICKNSMNNPNTCSPLVGFLKVTQDGQSDVYNDKGDRLSYKNKQEMYEEICLRT